MAKLPDNKKLKFIQNHPLYRSSYQKLKEFEKARTFCCHQMDHLLDVARIAYILNLEMNLGLDRELIYGAALLHDIGKSRQYEEVPTNLQAKLWRLRFLQICQRILHIPKQKNSRFSQQSLDTGGCGITQSPWRLSCIKAISCRGPALPVLHRQNVTGVLKRRIWRFDYDYRKKRI